MLSALRDSHRHSSQAHETVGLVAGWGRYPVLVAERLKQNGYRVACAALKDHADPVLNELCDHVAWLGVAKLGGQIKFLRKHQVQRMTMAGKLFKNDLIFQKHWMSLLPDWTCIKTFFPLFLSRKRDARDDSLLNAIVNAYESSQLQVCPATDFVPELLVSAGILTRRKPSAMELSDAAFGWNIAKQMGAMDIGQSITVRDSTVLAVEAVEGTDECIRRTGSLCRRGGWTLVKVAKPQQDMRFDVPTIGPLTIELLAAAGGTAIVIEADKTIIVDQPEVVEAADRAGISIIALDDAASVWLDDDYRHAA